MHHDVARSCQLTVAHAVGVLVPGVETVSVGDCEGESEPVGDAESVALAVLLVFFEAAKIASGTDK